jgi:hypothetical protein
MRPRLFLRTPKFSGRRATRRTPRTRRRSITFRPPYGKKLFELPRYLHDRGRRVTVTWDIEPESYPEIAADTHKIVEHVLALRSSGRRCPVAVAHRVFLAEIGERSRENC